MNATVKQQLRRNVCPLCYQNPAKTYSVPSTENEDGTLNIPAQPVFGIDPNHEPIDGYMSTRTIPGGTPGIQPRVTTIASGAQVYTVPANKKWSLESYVSDTTCTATVGNRILIVSVRSNDGTTLWNGPSSAAVAAAQVGGYDVGFGYANAPSTTVRRNLANTASTNVQVICSCPLKTLNAGCTVRILDTAAIDNADALNHNLCYTEYDA